LYCYIHFELSYILFLDEGITGSMFVNELKKEDIEKLKFKLGAKNILQELLDQVI